MTDRSYLNIEELERFESYALNTMNADDVKNFETALKKDDALRARFENFTLQLQAIEEQGLRDQLQEFHETLPPSKPISSKHLKYGIAASILLFAGSLMVYWLLSTTPNYERMYAKYFIPDPGLPTVMGNAEDSLSYSFYKAMVDYKQGSYTKALNSWQQLLKQRPTNDTLIYFTGVAHLANKDPKNAIALLKKTISKNQNSAFTQDAYYYLGMAYLKQGNIERSKQMLKQTSYDNAKAILKQLENEN